MKMKEVCERTALTERTVRFYMQKGLLAPQTEWRNGREYSEFSEKDIETLQAIAILRELTFSIEDIRTMQTTPELIAQIVAEKRSAAKLSHESAENTFIVLDHLDTEGIDSMMTLAERAREAAVHRPHELASEPPEEVNQSGMGDRCEKVPYEIAGKWNWGAFLCPVIWGLCNHVYLALMCFIPIVGLIFPFYLAKNGNELAWQYRYWESVDEFRRVQRRWAAWTIVISAAILALYAGTWIESAKAEKDYKRDLEALQMQLTQTEEWQEIVGGRTEWVEGSEKPIEYSANTTDGNEIWEDAFNEYFADRVTVNYGEEFYYNPDRYYRLIWSVFFESWGRQDDSIPLDDSEHAYSVEVELSDATAYEFMCSVNEKMQITGVYAEESSNYVQTPISQENVDEEYQYVKDYVRKRFEEVSQTEEWKETIGEGYTVTKIWPSLILGDYIYDGKMPECKGIYIHIRAADGMEYHVSIDAEYDEDGNSYELPLYIIGDVQ